MDKIGNSLYNAVMLKLLALLFLFFSTQVSAQEIDVWELSTRSALLFNVSMFENQPDDVVALQRLQSSTTVDAILYVWTFGDGTKVGPLTDAGELVREVVFWAYENPGLYSLTLTADVLMKDASTKHFDFSAIVRVLPQAQEKLTPVNRANSISLTEARKVRFTWKDNGSEKYEFKYWAKGKEKESRSILSDKAEYEVPSQDLDPMVTYVWNVAGCLDFDPT